LSLYYKAGPNTTKGQHFGSRIVFDKEGFLYFSAGEREKPFVNPQDITRDNGKIYRLNDDDGVFKRQPVCRPRKRKGNIYTYGNRNPQGLALNPFTGMLNTSMGRRAVTKSIL
jgi:glucose/arabinose dehydrogenase